MKLSQINAYVPEEFFLQGKDRMPCPLFQEDLALIDVQNGNRILACRGLFLKVGEKLPLSNDEQKLLSNALRELPSHSLGASPRILLRSGEHALICFTDLFFSCGLLAVLLPHTPIGLISHTLPYLLCEGDLLSPSLSGISKGNGSIEECYASLSEQIRLCEQILRPDVNADFRLHAAHVAQLAGCLASVIPLPVGAFPISEIAAKRWTAFLLGLFLLLRGDSATPTKMELAHADTHAFHLRVLHTPEAKRKIPLEIKLKEFLSRPCFSDIQLTKADGKLVLQTALTRKRSLLLHADPYGCDGMAVVLEILLE